jgi:hypothetical protein
VKFPVMSGFIGWRGGTFMLAPLPDDHPVVKAHPHLFKDGPAVKAGPAVEPVAERPKRGRPRKVMPAWPAVEPVVEDPAGVDKG